MRTHTVVLALLLVTALGGLLRTFRPSECPSGMHPDEAAPVWNALTIAETGRDQHGVRFPLVLSEGIGSLSMAQVYLMAPVAKLFGTDLVAHRVSLALLSALAIPLVFLVGRSLGGDVAGLGAALLLAVGPWHVQLSRWAHDSATVTILVLVPVVVAHAAGLGFRADPGKPSIPLAALAGLLFGAASYGYLALRLWVPVFLFAFLLARAGDLRERRRRLAAAALLGGFLVTWAPLAADFLRAGRSSERASNILVWDDGDSPTARASKVLARYPDHFSWRFLFSEGDRYAVHAPPPGWGVFPAWAAIPILVGAGAALARSRSDAGARALAAGLLVYPVADLVARHPAGEAGGAHLLRSSPGFWLLVLAGGLGIRRIADAVAGRPAAVRTAAAVLAAGIVAVSTWRFSSDFFGRFDGDDRRHLFQATLNEALSEARPLAPSYDAFVVTGSGTWHAGELALVASGFSAKRWLDGDRFVVKGPLPDGSHDGVWVCLAFGDTFVLAGGAAAPELERRIRDGRDERALFLVRPEEVPGLRGGRVLRRVEGPRGEDPFVLAEGLL